MNWIKFKGVKSDTIEGLIIQELPSISMPKKRVETITIDGRDGDITEVLGFEAYDKELSIGLYGNYDIDKINSYFSGDGELILSNEPTKKYYAKMIDGIDYQRLVVFRTANVKLHTQPFKYEINDMQEFTTGTFTLNNKGNYKSKPMFILEGSGEIIFKINGTTFFKYTFPDDETKVIINSKEEEAYLNDGTLRNQYMAGNFPILETGNNNITIEGTITKVQVEEISRWR